MKKAFTILELVFVILVIGILASIIVSNTKREVLYEAATQLIDDIRYTQHLAMIDDKFSNSDASWYKKRWSLRFNKDDYSNQEEAYTIFADIAGTSTGLANFSEVARNPQNPEFVLSGGITGESKLDIRQSIFEGTKKMNLGLSYDISSVVIGGGCNSKNIAFDHLGRPIDGRLNAYTTAYKAGKLIESRCTITLNSPEGSVVIAIEPETGYAHIL